MRFDDLKLTRQFLNAIEDAGYENATPIQQKAIPPLRAGQDVIGLRKPERAKQLLFCSLASDAKIRPRRGAAGLVRPPPKNWSSKSTKRR